MLTFRPLTSQDQQELWNWLHIALWDPPPAGLRPREVLDAAPVRIYAAIEAARNAGYRRVSLTVHPQNPAIRRYESCGFRKSGLRNTYHLMIAELA